MKYKVLKSVAHNWAHSFASDSNIVDEDFAMSYLVRAALDSGVSDLDIDLLTGSASPDTLLSEPVRKAVRNYVMWFPELSESQGVPINVIREAKASIRFHLDRRRPGSGSIETTGVPYEVTVCLVDDVGRKHVGEVSDEWFASKEPLFRRRRSRWNFWKRAV